MVLVRGRDPFRAIEFASEQIPEPARLVRYPLGWHYVYSPTFVEAAEDLQPIEHRLDWLPEVEEPEVPAPEVRPTLRIEPEVRGRDLTPEERAAAASRALAYRAGWGTFDLANPTLAAIEVPWDTTYPERFERALQTMRARLSENMAAAFDRAIMRRRDR